MYLLKVETNVLEEFTGTTIPKYAILSHTWGDHEVSFQDMQRGETHQHDRRTEASLAKIRGACKQAALDGLAYIWVDTCCIDKSSSSELSEALNSMFRWYRNAEICYAFLADVPPDDDCVAEESKFRRSRWFTRGWTLQELLAPTEVVFFSSAWTRLGTRTELRRATAEITHIDESALDGSDSDLSRFSIAHRMSWASRRATTRVEDMAYCLLGLFGVNMALLYGEGERAFIRLQEEIIKSSEDHSIFAWIAKGASADTQRGLLADSPSEFAESGGITSFREVASTSVAYAMTNKGLSITLNIVPTTTKNEYIATLNCPGLDSHSVIGIRVRRLASIGDRFCRVGTGRAAFSSIQNRGWTATLFVQQRTVVNPSLNPSPASSYDSLLLFNSTIFTLDRIYDAAKKPIPRNRSNGVDVVTIANGGDGWIAAMCFTGSTGHKDKFWISLGSTPELGVCVFLETRTFVPHPFFHRDLRGPSILEGEVRYDRQQHNNGVITVTSEVAKIVLKVNLRQGGDKRVLILDVRMG